MARVRSSLLLLIALTACCSAPPAPAQPSTAAPAEPHLRLRRNCRQAGPPRRRNTASATWSRPPIRSLSRPAWDARAGRQRHRRRHRGADDAHAGRAAVVRHRRWRVPHALRPSREVARGLRRTRDGAGRGDARPVPRQSRQAARVHQGGGRRTVGRHAWRDEADGARPPEARQAAVGDALRAGDRSRRGRLRDLAAPPHDDRRHRDAALHAEGRGRVFPETWRLRSEGRGLASTESRARGHVPHLAGGRRQGVYTAATSRRRWSMPFGRIRPIRAG